MNVLVFTPTPTHPAIQGNRQRVFDMCRAMQSLGADITLVYYSTEGVGSTDVHQMRDAWHNVEIVFPRGFVPRQSLVRYPSIDDWYDDDITAAVEGLCLQNRFDVCFVNYAWYSKMFEVLPPNIVRVIDTHDVFGGRAKRFTEIGLDPVWFHTSEAEEKKGLDRADIVIAIQDGEAEILKGRTDAVVRSLGFLSSPDFLPLRSMNSDDRLVVGYIGSANPFNVSSILAFRDAIDKHPIASAKLEFHLAGSICDALASLPHPFFLKGVVTSVAGFYESIDAAVNPMIGGTGLKIKSLETLSFGKPLVATIDAMAGIPTKHAGHNLPDASQMLDYLVDIAGNADRIEEEARKSREVFLSYRNMQLHAFRSLWSEIDALAKKRRGSKAVAPEQQGAS